ncbi:hypothetical protein OJJOAM_004587 [Cupriavidus sp. H18C1]|uniref:helix-turn-helix domain-containing protein n=1 Tax=Cupriavidus sp. H18C1 TaxID=3241601 RepID=UPI003BB8BF11
MPEFVSYRPPLNPGLDADHSALELLPHSVARDQRGHQTWFGYLRTGSRREDEVKARSEALVATAAKQQARCEFVSERYLERHRYLFDNWLVLSRAMTAAASYPREAEADALVAILASEGIFQLGEALRWPQCDPAMMLAVIARELQLGRLGGRPDERVDWSGNDDPSGAMMAVSGARKRVVPAFGDPANWPQPSIESFSESARATYRRRERAVRLYVAHVPFDVITRETGLSRREVYRLLDRFTAPHPVHGIFGLLALVPGQRIRGYRRQKPVRENAGNSSGYAGALGALIDRVPQALELIYEELLGTRAPTEPMCDRAPTFRVLHRHWLAALRDVGLSDVDWPFCTGDRGYTTLVRFCKTLMQRYPDRAVRRRFGKAAAQRMASVGHGVPALIHPQRPGSFAILDFSRVDAASCLSLETPEGRVLHQVLPRWYIAMLVDELTTATWSAFATLEIEPSADSVLETLDRAIRPHAYADASRTEQGQALAIHIQELVPELGFSGVTVLKLDNAKCNRAHEVVSNIIDTLGCAINFGPPYQWQRRSAVEKTIGQVSADGIKRLASSYGTGPGGSSAARCGPGSNSAQDRLPRCRAATF